MKTKTISIKKRLLFFIVYFIYFLFLGGLFFLIQMISKNKFTDFTVAAVVGLLASFFAPRVSAYSTQTGKKYQLKGFFLKKIINF